MKTRILALAAWLALANGAMAAGTALINLEEAAEVVDIEIRLSDPGSGRIYGRLCDHCELLTLKIDSEAQILRGNRRLTLGQAAARKGGATVLFDPATRRVTRVLFWN